MPLHAETLHPLTLASFVLDYRLEDDPLQVVAKRFSHPESSQKRPHDSCTDITLLLTSGIGTNCELWLPTIKHLFDEQAKSDSHIYIRHVWAVEWPNYGDAAVLNEIVLKEHYSEAITQRNVGIAVRRLVRSGLIDLENSKLVGLSHSAGCGSHLVTDSEIGLLPFHTVILLEPPLFNSSALPAHKQFIARNIAVNKIRPDLWPTLEDAMTWHKGRAPWNTWHSEVLQVFAETNFRNVPTAYHSQTKGVTPKTYKGQDAASFNPAEELYRCIDHLRPLCASIPVHVIFGSRKDFWPRKLSEVVEETTRAFESSFASITFVPAAGHYVAQENPRGLATVIFQLLRKTPPAAKL